MADYKTTLNLPSTPFPMKASLPVREPDMLAHWEAIDLFGKIQSSMQGRVRFVFHDGPPYANARPHMGTALNKTLKDIVVKSKVMSGYDATFVPGWDCHGLPIELNVEKKIGKAGVKVPVPEFRAACRAYAEKQVDLQRTDFKRMGVLADWDHPYLTMHTSYEAGVVRTLAKILENGHLLRGEKPVHWCTACGSALAEAEVEYKDKISPAIDVAFSASDAGALARVFGVDVDQACLPIWTTTPWTLPANQAVAVNPKLTYALVKTAKNCFVVANDLVASVMSRYGITDFSIAAEVAGEALAGITLQHPFLDRTVPVVLGDHVTTDAGTGCVHTAPAHGQDDYVVSQRAGLPIDNPVNASSCFVEATPLVAGMHVTKANDPIIEALKERGVLLALDKIEHSYPHCWRHKTPLIFRATPQWFISMDQAGLREMALVAIEKVNWIPAWGQKRIHNMIVSRPDWCISRQRAYGSPIVLIVHRDTNNLHPNMLAIMQTVADMIEKDGVDAWFDCELSSLIDNADEYVKVTDTIDVWFDAGISHFCVLKQRESLGFPADVYFEGSDQHRGWFQSALLTALAIDGVAPFKAVNTHGYVVDAKGHKMSKSVGNVILPADIMQKMGADVMRLWVASMDYHNDISVSDEILKRASDAYRRIRNTSRFLLSNLYDFQPANDALPVTALLSLDAWIVARATALQAKIVAAYDAYEYHGIYQWIHNFCSNDLGSFYLDIIKDRQYTCAPTGHARRSSQTAMALVLEMLVRWLAPIISFTAEEIWRVMPGEREESVFLTTWFETPMTESNEALWETVRAIRDCVNVELEAKRNAGDIGSALDANVTLYADATLYPILEQLKDELRFALITSGARVLPMSACPDALTCSSVEGMYLQVDVSESEKCARCWQRRETVGTSETHSDLCDRCELNITDEKGEVRVWC